jgi:hypothetical protein
VWWFDPSAGPDGRAEDLGRALGDPDMKTEPYLEYYNVRGLVFGADGKLYFCMRVWREGKTPMHLARLNVRTLEREVVAILESDQGERLHIASATADYYGNLYFADAARHPTGMHVYRPDAADAGRTVFSWKDVKQWG